MLRLITAVLFTSAFVAFVMTNAHPVTISFVIGPPVRIRLIFLLLSTFFCGVALLAFSMMVLRIKAKRRAKHPATAVPTAEQKDLLTDE